MAWNSPFSSSGIGDEHSQSLSFLGRDNIKSATDLVLSVSLCVEENKVKIYNLAVAAAEELLQMALEKEPLWLIDRDRKTEVLNNAEYNHRFARLDATLEEVIRVISTGEPMGKLDSNENANALSGIGSSSRLTVGDDFPLLEIEASRAVGFAPVDPLRLVNMFMDVDRWSSAFSNIVSKASNLGILTTGEPGNPHGALQVVRAEFHFPSPFVQTRETYFARYCKKLDSNSWIVVDVSLETVFPNFTSRCGRKPSGCLIQSFKEGSSKVIWVENNAVNDGSLQGMFSQLSGLAFGAKRWIATLEREYDRNSFLGEQFDQLTTGKRNDGFENGRKNLLKVTERMVRGFNANLSSCLENSWRTIPITGAEDILIKTSFNKDDPGVPRGVAVTIATSIHLQKPQKDVFEFLCSTQKRDKWDMLSRGRHIQEIECISCGPEPENQVSILLSVPMPDNRAEKDSNRNEMMYVQETFSDSMGLYVVHSTVEKGAIHHIMDGKDSTSVSILPCGFVVLPESDPAKSENIGGSILTMVFEIMDDSLSIPEHTMSSQSVSIAHNIIRITVDMIKDALSQSKNTNLK